MKRFIHNVSVSIGVLTIMISLISIPRAVANPASFWPHLIISEVQPEGVTDGVADGKREFIELYNPTDQSLALEGVRLEYLSAAHTGTGPPTRTLIRLAGVVAPQSHILISAQQYFTNATFYFNEQAVSSSGLLALSGGHIRLIDVNGAVLDSVSWGNAKKIGEWWSSAAMQASMSIQRLLPEEAGFQETGLAYAAPSINITPEGSEPARLEPDTPPVVDPPTPLPCKDLELSEILPNASGTDTGHEFIEVFNPSSEAISLAGCALRVGVDGPSFPLPDEVLLAGGYRTFYDSESNLSLPNASAQTVYLLSPTQHKEARYANAMPEDAAWVWLEGEWQTTNMPTPGTANSAAVQKVSPPEPVSQQSLPCPVGKERSAETNRCKNIPNEVPIRCKAGQEVNLSTNRCRKISAGVLSSVTPCRVGQERNPATNRCRASGSPAKSLSECAAGQERNPQTNRCRKAGGSASKQFASIQDVSTKTGDNMYRWWIAAIVVTGAVGYVLYEWRNDVRNITHRWIQRCRAPKIRK